MIRQVLFSLFFVIWQYTFIYFTYLPYILFNKENNILLLTKILGQSLVKMLCIAGLNAKFYLCRTEQKIKEKMNEDISKIDIIISNHTFTLDYFMIFCILKKYKIINFYGLIGTTVKNVPGAGLFMYLDDNIEINRNWDLDKDIITSQLDNIKINDKKQVIILFPEGHRMSEIKLQEAKQFSLEKNIHKYNNLLVPKIKGLYTIVNHLNKSGRLGNIWDFSLIFPKYLQKEASTIDVIKNSIGKVYVNIRTVDIKPNENYEEFKENIYNIWKIKDEIITNYKLFYYDKIYFGDKNTFIPNIIFSVLMTIFFIYLLTKKRGRQYYIFSIILSYILININIKKIKKNNLRIK